MVKNIKTDQWVISVIKESLKLEFKKIPPKISSSIEKDEDTVPLKFFYTITSIISPQEKLRVKTCNKHEIS